MSLTKTKLIFSLAFSLLWVQVLAQTNNQSKSDIIEDRIEFIAQDFESEDIDFTTLFDDLYQILENPIDLNTATSEDLKSIQFLTDFQIANLIRYRINSGTIYSLFELKAIEGFSTKNIEMLLPFVTVKSSAEKKKVTFGHALKYGKNQVILRQNRIIQEQLGFSDISDSLLNESPNSRYKGDPNQLYIRYRYKYRNKYSVGFTAEKDAGEEFFSGSNKNGFDFYSGHLVLYELGIVKKVIVGDYQVQFGQGLTFWSGFGFRKNVQSPNEIKRYARGIQPYTAANENQFMRGGAVTLQRKGIELTTFYSRKNVDANLELESQTDSLGEEQLLSFSSLQLTGLHRTEGEIADKDAIEEEYMGGNLNWRKDNFQVGLTAAQSRFNTEFNRTLQLYNQFEFSDDENLVMGADYHWNLNTVLLFGEVSQSQNGAIAHINGAIVNVEDRLKVSAFYRDYPEDYQNLNSGAIAEKSRPLNEQGLYIATEFNPIRRVYLSAFLDNYRFPWLSFQIDAPSSGMEFGSQLTWKVHRRFEVLFLYRTETEMRNFTSESALKQLEETTISQYRMQTTANINDCIKLRNRLEIRVSEKESEPTYTGYLLYQDVYFNSSTGKWGLRLRYALFDVEDFEARVYAYENDLLYQFSVPSFNNRGTRAYAVASCQINSFLTAYAKIAQTTYSNIDEIGSGLNLIDGNRRTEFRTQLVFKF